MDSNTRSTAEVPTRVTIAALISDAVVVRADVRVVRVAVVVAVEEEIKRNKKPRQLVLAGLSYNNNNRLINYTDSATRTLECCWRRSNSPGYLHSRTKP